VSAKIVRIAGGALWLFAVVAGFVIILNYQTASGTSGQTPAHWPALTNATLDLRRHTLVMFAHPHCPCTRASLEELNRLMARSEGRIAAEVFFYRPSAFDSNWIQSDLSRSAAAIPGVSVHEDVDGALARRFGAETSGYVLLYDTSGQLLFKGGITGSRGHAGDNEGEDAIVLLSAGQNAPIRQTQVYGCSLLGNCNAKNDTLK
jgi:hypothetical protein